MRFFLLLLTVASLCGCLTPKAHENPKTADELRVILQDFHMKMRWGLWEQAAAYTSPTYRNEFLGRYEELGDDFKIVDLEIKQVTLDDPVTTVDVEQESYREPDMVVQKKRYIERWAFAGGSWVLHERLPKDEWRERQKAEQAAADDAPAAEGVPEPDESDLNAPEEPTE